MLFLTFSLYFASVSLAQSSTLAQPPVGTPIASLDSYDGPYRPQLHFSPPQGFMNDPNGLFVDPTGIYHLYYQLNPTELVAGNQHWGHATSPDLYHWTNQPIAISPSADNPQGLIFSGSAVLDPDNTSGFFPAGSLNTSSGTIGVIATYTLNTPTAEVQNLAYSTDNGYTFTNYSANPVLNDNNYKNFRDPKVTFHEPTQRWVMAVAFADLYIIGFYTSPNMKDWTPASNFSAHGLLGLQWECPNLVEVPLLKDAYAPLDQKFALDNVNGTAWFLMISINPGAPQGGSITQFFTGSFNGTHFEPADGAARLTDWGKDNYAGQLYSGIDATQPQVLMTWASNWQYTNNLPTAPSGFRSIMGVPRHIALAQNTPRSPWTLIQSPFPIPPSLYTTSSPPPSPNASSSTDTATASTPLSSFAPSSYASNTIPLLQATNLSLTNTSTTISLSRTSVLPSGAFVLTLTASNLSSTSPQTGMLNFTLSANTTSTSSSSSSSSSPSTNTTSEDPEALRGGFILSGDGTGLAWLDRSAVKGYTGDPTFTSQFSTTYVLDKDSGRGTFEMMAIIDRSVIEVFLDGGVGPSGTMVFFPEAQGGLDVLVLAAEVGDGVGVTGSVRGLGSAWAEGEGVGSGAFERGFLL